MIPDSEVIDILRADLNVAESALRDIATGNTPDDMEEDDTEAQLCWSQDMARAALTLIGVDLEDGK